MGIVEEPVKAVYGVVLVPWDVDVRIIFMLCLLKADNVYVIFEDELLYFNLVTLDSVDLPG